MSMLHKMVVLVLFLIFAGALFIYSGIYNVAATSPHWPVIRWLLQNVQEQSINARKQDITAPASLLDEERAIRGGASYGAMCQMCHLGPGVEPTPLYQGLLPEPPQLTRIARERSPEFMFWATKYGIKMTGMPAWGETHSDEALWDIIAFVTRLPQMTPEEYAQATAAAHEHEH